MGIVVFLGTSTVVVGAIGVSGGRPDQDHQVAEAGLKAFAPANEPVH